MNPELLLFIIKLVIGGIVGFMAILLMSKTRDAAWMCMVGGFLLSYAALVFELMEHLGIFSKQALLIIIGALILVAGVVFVQEAERRIPILVSYLSSLDG